MPLHPAPKKTVPQHAGVKSSKMQPGKTGKLPLKPGNGLEAEGRKLYFKCRVRNTC